MKRINLVIIVMLLLSNVIFADNIGRRMYTRGPAKMSQLIDDIGIQQKADSLTWDATKKHVADGLLPKLDKAAFEDSIRSTFRKIVYVRPGENIQAAFASLTGLSATQYGAVVLLPGTHTITSQINMRRYSALLGYGKNISILKATSDIHMVYSDSSCIIVKDLSLITDLTSVVPTKYLINITTSVDFGTEIIPFKIDNVNIIAKTAVSAENNGSPYFIHVTGTTTHYNYLLHGSSITNCEINFISPGDLNGGSIRINLYACGGVAYNDKDYPFIIKNNIIQNCKYGIRLQRIAHNYILLDNNFVYGSPTYTASSHTTSITSATTAEGPTTAYINGGIYDDRKDAYGVNISGVNGKVTTCYVSNAIIRRINAGNYSTIIPLSAQNVLLNYTLTDTSTVNDNYGVVPNISYTAADPVIGSRVTFKAAVPNTGSATFKYSNGTAKTIKKNYNQDLETGDILAGQYVELIYDGTNYQLISARSLTTELGLKMNTGAFTDSLKANFLSTVFNDTSAVNDSYGFVTGKITAYTTNMRICFKAAVANTDAATLQINSLGAKAIKKKHDEDLVTGDVEVGQYIEAIYDGTYFQMLSQLAQ